MTFEQQLSNQRNIIIYHNVEIIKAFYRTAIVIQYNDWLREQMYNII